MRRQSPPTTAWEIEAARRQEVVAADFGAGARTGTLSRLSGWLTSVRRTTVDAPTDRVDQKTPCPPNTVRAIKPGA